MWHSLIQYGPVAAFWLFALAAQMSGYTNTAIALAITGVAAFLLVVPCCHHIVRWQKRRKEAGLGVIEPHHLIIAGVIGALLFTALAGGGLLWQRYLVVQRSDVVDFSKITPTQAAQPSAAPEKPKVKTHPHDIPKKLTAIDDEIIPLISDGGEIERHVKLGRQLLNSWKAEINKDRPAFMAQLQSYDQTYSGILDQVAKIQRKNSHFEDIASLLEIPNSPYNYKETITKSFASFKGAIGAIGDPPYKMDLDYFFTPTQQNFSSGLVNLNDWRKHAENEFIQLRKQIASGE